MKMVTVITVPNPARGMQIQGDHPKFRERSAEKYPPRAMKARLAMDQIPA